MGEHVSPLVVRLNRYLSQCGLGSRRGCEQLILEGRVAINGHFTRELASQVEEGDKVTVDGRPTRPENGVVIALHKPRGYICSRSDERDRMTIYALLPKPYQTLHHIGRLDKESEGLLLMTNRGDLSHRLIHPSQGAEKEYEVIVDQPMDQTTMAKMVSGMMTEEGYAKAERAWLATEYRAHVVLKQGLKRQIRLMFYQLGFEVKRLTRTRIGWLELRGLQKGGWRQLTEAEVERFFAKDGAVGRPQRPVKDAAPESLDSDTSLRRSPRRKSTSEYDERPRRAARSGASESRSRPDRKRVPRGAAESDSRRPRQKSEKPKSARGGDRRPSSGRAPARKTARKSGPRRKP